MKKTLICLAASFLIVSCKDDTNRESLLEEPIIYNSETASLDLINGWNDDHIFYNGEASLQFDFYKPSSASPTPLIIAIHGGGFLKDEDAPHPENQMRFDRILDDYGFPWVTAAQMDNRKVAYVTISYREASVNNSYNVLTSLNDVQSFVQYFQDNAASYNIDPNNIVLMGVSAGASSALWVGLQNNVSGIKGLVCFNPQATLNLRDWEFTIFNTSATYDGWYNYGRLTPDILEIDSLIYRGMKRSEPSLKLVDLMDSSDPEIYLVNTWADSVIVWPGPYTIYGDYLHHPRHIERLINRANNTGQTCRLMYYAHLGYADPSQETIIDFVKRVCQ